MASRNHNVRNPAVKRILQELKEVHGSPSPDFLAEANQEDIFEWYFVMRGPPDTEFEGGIYHGRIHLPPEYPLKPPSFVMLTPSGRFETNVKICLSISAHHPEEWQPSWSMSSALTALVAFMPTPGNGALGALDFPPAERRALALRSRSAVPTHPNRETQQLIKALHEKMLQRSESAAGADGQDRAQGRPTPDGERSSPAADDAKAPLVPNAEFASPRPSPRPSPNTRSNTSSATPKTTPNANEEEVLAACLAQRRLMSNTQMSSTRGHFSVRGYPSELTLLTLAVFLGVAIVAIAAKKVLIHVYGVDINRYF